MINPDYKYSGTNGIQHEEPLLFEHAHEAPESTNLPGVEGPISDALTPLHVKLPPIFRASLNLKRCATLYA